MKAQQDFVTGERQQSLWLLVWAPTIWAAHFLGSYILAALSCRHGQSSGWAAFAIAALAMVAIVAIGVVGIAGWNRHKLSGERTTHQDTDQDRHRFIGFATILLAALSAIATLYVAVGVLVSGNCK